MCLNREQIEKLLRTEETSDDLTAFRDHARTCERCRAEAARAAERVLVGKVALEGGHLEPVTLSHYLDDGLSPHLRLLLDVHLEACGYCRERLEAMQAGRQHAAAQPVREFLFKPVVVPNQPGETGSEHGYAGAMAAQAAGGRLRLIVRSASVTAGASADSEPSGWSKSLCPKTTPAQ